MRYAIVIIDFELKTIKIRYTSFLTFILVWRKSCWNLNEMSGKPRVHPIHSHWRYGITGESKVLENVIVNIEQVFYFILYIC
jgi:hypothetical protein